MDISCRITKFTKNMTDLVNNPFYNGLTVGILMGVLLCTVASYISINKRFGGLFAKSVDETQLPVPKSSARFKSSSRQFKMALLVRQDLKMGKGKVAAQCSHAIVHCYEAGLKLNPQAINCWETDNKPVDVFKVADEEIMLGYQQLAIGKRFITYIVTDAGRTQVAPGSKTVMAIGPVESEQIDLFTKSLQCAVVSVIAYNKSKLCGLPSNCARIILRAPDLKTLECIQKQCKLFDIQTAVVTENDQINVLAIGPADEVSINAQTHNLKLY